MRWKPASNAFAITFGDRFRPLKPTSRTAGLGWRAGQATGVRAVRAAECPREYTVLMVVPVRTLTSGGIGRPPVLVRAWARAAGERGSRRDVSPGQMAFSLNSTISQRRRPARTASSRQRSGDSRARAKDQGIAVSARGRIPASVATQYQAAAQ
jgi:hypothetical protein